MLLITLADPSFIVRARFFSKIGLIHTYIPVHTFFYFLIIERNNSSTWRELKAVELALISFAPSLLGKQVAWFTGDTNVVSIVHSRSKVRELQDLTLRIFHVCVSFGISLEMKWIPRDLNSFADHLSRIIDFDDYTIKDDVFQILDFQWGPHTIDRFVCSYNAKLSCFNSRFYQPGTEAVDAFLQD